MILRKECGSRCMSATLFVRSTNAKERCCCPAPGNFQRRSKQESKAVRSSKANSPEVSWTVPVVVTDIPDDGADIAIDANEADRAAIARVAGLRDLARLAASFHLAPAGRGQVRVEGRVSAVVGQTCVVTLE